MLAYTPDNIEFDGGGMLLFALGTCGERSLWLRSKCRIGSRDRLVGMDVQMILWVSSSALNCLPSVAR